MAGLMSEVAKGRVEWRRRRRRRQKLSVRVRSVPFQLLNALWEREELVPILTERPNPSFTTIGELSGAVRFRTGPYSWHSGGDKGLENCEINRYVTAESSRVQVEI
jgi:hypothetical protein